MKYIADIIKQGGVKMKEQAGRISKIGPHVYVKGSAEAVEMYKNAFNLEDKGGTSVDKDGDIYHRVLAKNGEYFMSVSEDKYMHDGLKKEYPNGVRPTMVFTVALENEDEMRNTYNILSTDGIPCNGLIVEPGTTLYGDVFDKFGVLWCLYVPQN
jgi:uncharacterized glyoxalase superfamily protein PhnB